MTENTPEDQTGFEVAPLSDGAATLTLLNLLPDPALIYDRVQERVLMANNALYLLTQLEEKDFLHQNIRTLLPNLTDLSPVTGHGQKSRLRHKKQPLILVTLRIFSLSGETDHLLMLLHPEGINPMETRGAAPQTDIIEKFHALINARQEKDLLASLEQILFLAQDLLHADLVCLYKASGAMPQLGQYLATDANLAAQLPNPLKSEDLINTQEATLWTAEQPARNAFQRAAASAGFKSLVVVPLGRNTPKFGLLVAGGKTSEADETTLSMAKMIADHAGDLIKDRLALQDSQHFAQKIKQVVKIQNEIINNLEEGVLILSPDLTIAEINPAAEEMLGYANVEALRQPVDTVLIGSESFGSAFSSAREGYPTLMRGELTLHHRNGRSFPAQALTAPVMSQGTLLSILVLIRDNSKVVESQAEKKQLEQRAILGEVTAIFAHEVRNPLNAITLSLQVIEENLAEDDENMKWVQKSLEECNNLIQLMESVLSFAKPLEYRMGEVNLAELIQRLLDRWRPRLVRLEIASYFETDVADPVVRGDLRALEQVFTNLISNAVQAMSEDGGYLGIKITEAERTEDQPLYQVNITDSGPGISDEVRAKMFKPFVTGSKHGTGLGLAITQRIINAHKGKIEVDSFPGGTIFKVFLTKLKKVS